MMVVTAQNLCKPIQRSYVRDALSKIGLGYAGSVRIKAAKQGESIMPEVTIVYWRDIPAQVIVGKGRRGAKKQLPERFEQAIDRAAMKSGAAETDDYLAEWRKAPTYPLDGEPDDIASREAARLDNEYDKDRLMDLIDADGWERE